jgi:hypothetical protein
MPHEVCLKQTPEYPDLSSLSMKKLALTVVTLVALAGASRAQTWGGANPGGWLPGYLAVMRVGDGVEALSSSGNSVFIDQYATSGSQANPYNFFSIPNSGATALIQAGSSSSEGMLTRDGNSGLVFMGYNSPILASGSIVSSSGTTVPRVVGRVSSTGDYGIVYSSSTAFSGSNPRAAVADASGNYWGVGAGSSTANRGVYYFGPSTATFIHNGTGSISPRDVELIDGNLLFSGAPTSGTRGVFGYTGTPTTSQGATIPPVVINTGATSSPYDFVINSALGIAYVADDTAGTGGGVQRYAWVGGAWTLQYTLSTGATSGARGLAVDFSNTSDPLVYVTTSETSSTTANRLGVFSDTGSGASFNLLASAPAGEQFKGLEFAPTAIPEPAAGAMVGLGLLLWWRARRAR